MRNKHPSATAAKESRRRRVRSEAPPSLTAGPVPESTGTRSIFDKVGKEVLKMWITVDRYCFKVTICMIQFCDPWAPRVAVAL